MDSPTEGISVHSMRLKVLYTFDTEHKNNHLARYPQALDIQTAFVDEVTQVGIIDLRTCLEAVTEASPELLSNPDNDFTIYAYDYSEQDTPLVGQGLLSRQLQNQAENGDSDNENMITGRITKNVKGLFGKGAQETLEVKLRFNPVAPPNDFRSISQGSRRGSISGQDATQQWSMSGQAIQRSASPLTATGLETMQRMLSEGGPPRDRAGSVIGGDTYYGRAGSRPPSRPGTPTQSQPFNPPMRQSTAAGSRPSSRAGMHQGSHARRDSFNSGYYSGEEAVDDGPVRKRAKITKINQPSRSDLNIERQPDSLRVVASTASSVRIHRPIPVNPALALQTGASTEEPVRPPTPIPTKTGRPRGRPRKNPISNLNKFSRARPSSPADEPGSQSFPSQLPDISMSSPEDSRPRSASSTPANFPSSPPVMPDRAPLASSPKLPPLSGDHDSGFISSNFDDIFGGGNVLHFEDFLNDHTDAIPDVQILDTVGQTSATNTYEPVFDDGNDIDENVSAVLPPPALVVNSAELPPPPRPLSRSQSYAPPPQINMSSPKPAPAPIPRVRLTQEERHASEMAQIPMSDPIGRNFHRSNTWAGDMSDFLTSEAPTGDEPRTKNSSRKRVGKDQTRARLEAAIASGELPPYCDNCGAIETPAWRRAYRRDFNCPWDDVEQSLEDGACNFKEPTEWNEDGSIKAFKGYKTFRKQEERDDEWVAVSLCNPCGLWFHKQKCMRPPEKWQKKDPAEKRKRQSRTKSQRGAANKNGGGLGAKTDAATPASDGSSPGDTATEAAEVEDRDNNGEAANDSNEPELPPMPRIPRANSAEPVVRALRFGMVPMKRSTFGARGTKSSPINGSAKEPIELDLTPQPIRRQLFPSPDKSKSYSEPVPGTKPPSGKLPALVRRSPRLNKTTDFLTQSASAAVDQNKENTDAAMQDGHDDLFNHVRDNDDMLLTPTTPIPKRRSERIMFKTPSKTPQRAFGESVSPNVRRSTPSLRTPTMVSAKHPVVSALLGTNKMPKDMTPFTRSIHDALAEVSSQYVATSPHGPSGNQLVDYSAKGVLDPNVAFDFPDLPSLKGSSPMSNNPMLQFDFSELTTEQLNTDYNDVFSTDAAVPSSPPLGIFDFIHSNEDGTENFWEADGVGNGGFEAADRNIVSIELGPAQVLRRSPRKR